jgi:hypothetical protein
LLAEETETGSRNRRAAPSLPAGGPLVTLGGGRRGGTFLLLPFPPRFLPSLFYGGFCI